MDRQEFFDKIKKYFALSEMETEKLLQDKFHKDIDKNRFMAMFYAVMPHLERFVDEADEKLKRKVGKVFLSKLDYSQFYDKESVAETKERLQKLFYQTSSKGINIYKILYCSVLTDGNLKRDNDTRSRFYDSSRDFENIYDSLVEALHLSADEAKEIFERCSSLIAKGYAYKFPHIYNKLYELIVMDETGAYRVFSQKQHEVEEILKINPSLFVISTDRIQSSFDYLQKKMYPILRANIDEVMQAKPNMTLLAYRTIMARKWLKNNSSLLTINVSSMYDKEKYLKQNLNAITGNTYAVQFANFFESPLNIATLNQIPYEKITRNALRNIQLLEKYTTKEKVARYLTANQYVVGMDYAKFGTLLYKIEELDKENPQEKYFDKFLEFGKTLFASNIDFSVDAIADKLVHNAIIRDVAVDEMTDKECLQQFIEIFFDGKHDLTFKIEDMIKQRRERNANGEKELRSDIRKMGRKIEELPRILKDESTSTKEKRERVLTYARDISALQGRRLALAGNSATIGMVQTIEEDESRKIEETLNLLRETFEQRRFKLGKSYTNLEQLFERTMNYLDTCFDDKGAISQLFKVEIIDNFTQAMKETYDVNPSAQQSLFGERLTVENVTPGLKSPLKGISQEINKVDFHQDGTSLEFIK